MVQIGKDKLRKVQLGVKAARPNTWDGRRKNAPLQFAKPKVDRLVTGAISRNIEDIMTARVEHEGGYLRVLKAPENVFEFAKGGARVSDKVLKQRSGQIGWRKVKVADREKELRIAMDKEVRKEERSKLKRMVKEREKEQQEALDRLKSKREQNSNEVDLGELDHDDVAGDFFDDVIGQDFFENNTNFVKTELKPELVGAKNAKGGSLTTKQLERRDALAQKKVQKKLALESAGSSLNKKTPSGPAKRANVKGLHDEAAMSVMDDKF